MTLPCVSIIIPAYNAQSTLRLCLDSVMNVDYPKDKLEIIIVNNNSTDSTEDIAMSYPITVLREEKIQSSYASRNRGIQYAKGEILAFTDTDCIVSPAWLKKLLASCGDQEIGCFAGDIASYNPETLAEQYAEREEENHDQLRCLTVGYLPYAQTANVAYRREVFEDIGLFNSNFKSGGDVDLTWRMVKRGRFKIVYEPEAIVYHKHRSSIRNLYRQQRTYGEGMGELLKIYPNSCGGASGFIKDIFAFSLRGIRSFPKNQYLYKRGRIARIDVWFYFLKALCRLGLVVGRIKAESKKEDGSISRLLMMRYLFSKLLKRVKPGDYRENSACK